MTKWISYLDDEAPDNDQVVLVYSKKGGYEIAKYSCGIEDYGGYDIEYEYFWRQNSDGEYIIMHDVICWMPIPKLPEDCYE